MNKYSVFKILGFFVLGIALFVLFVSSTSRNRKLEDGKFDFKKARSDLAPIFERQSSSDAYARFKDTYERYGIEAHNLAHWVGERLYDKEGFPGIAICDSTFTYGCYHGFLIRALEVDGDTAIKNAETACNEIGKSPLEKGGCLHGIGHGLMGRTNGYTRDHLLVALADCDKLTMSFSQDSCRNGVFMEFNLHTMEEVTRGKLSARPLGDDPYEPCNMLPVDFRSDCYFELSSWWKLVLQADYQRMGELCEQLDENIEQDACARGIGRAIGTDTPYDGMRIASVCASLPSLVSFPCLTSALEQAVNENRPAPEAICDAVSGSQKTQCLDYEEQLLCAIHGACGRK